MPNKGVPVNLDRTGRKEHIEYHESIEVNAKMALEMIEETKSAADYATGQGDRAKEYSDNIELVMKDGPVQTVNGDTGNVTGLATKLEIVEVKQQLKGDIDITNEQLTEAKEMLGGELDLLANKIGGVKLSELQEPLIFAHRGAKSVFPESSLEAFRACVSWGLPIELDVRLSADNIMVVHHDATVTRTTDKTGRVDSYSLMGFKNTKITELGTSLVGTPVTLEELFVEFGNKAVYIIESKERGSAQPLVDMIFTYKLEENCLVQSFDRSDLNPALVKGVPTMLLTTTANPVTAKNDGIDYIGVSKTVSEAYIAECLSAGLKVGVYTVSHRYEFEKFKGLGVTAFFSDDPLWTSGQSKDLASDPFEQHTYYHGHLSPPESRVEHLGSNGLRGDFVGAGQFGWEKASDGGMDYAMQGWAGELPPTFEFKVDIFPKELVANTMWAGIMFCTPIDFFDDSGELSYGYNLLIRETGSVDLFKITAGASVNLGNVRTASLATSSRVTFVIAVSGTKITVTRTDSSANNDVLVVDDATYRGGYLHFGRREIGVTFGNSRITR